MSRYDYNREVIGSDIIAIQTSISEIGTKLNSDMVALETKMTSDVIGMETYLSELETIYSA